MKYKRVIVSRYGASEVLQVVEDDLPEPQHNQVRVKILAAGVSFADVLLREGIHPETKQPPFTPGWDIVGIVEKLGSGVSKLEVGQQVAALPVVGGYAEYICLPPEELIPIPETLEPTEAVCLVLNYGTAYQMLHRTAKVKNSARVLIHAAGGGVGTALLQLGALNALEMYGTASLSKHQLVSELGGTPIDYKQVDFVKEIHQRTGDGVDAVFDAIGGKHLWRSYRALRRGGQVVAFGHATSLINSTLTYGRRSRLRGLPTIAAYIALSAVIPDRRKIVLYSIQTLKRRKPSWFHEDMGILFDLLLHKKIQPIITECLPLVEAQRAHDLLGRGSVSGRIVLICN